MRFLGGKVVLTPAAARAYGMVTKAVELAQTDGWFLTRGILVGITAGGTFAGALQVCKAVRTDVTMRCMLTTPANAT